MVCVKINLTTLIKNATYFDKNYYVIYIYIYAKRWKVQLNNGLRKINLTTLIQKATYFDKNYYVI